MMTLNEAMFIYAHSQNERGVAHLEATQYGTQVLNKAKRNSVILSLEQRHKDFVDGIIEYHDTQVYPRLNEMFLAKFGMPLPKELRYFPIKSLERGTGNLADFYADYSNLVMFSNGFLKGRTGSTAAFTQPAFRGDFTRNAINVETTLALQDNALKAARILQDPKLSSKLRGWSELGYQEFSTWLRQAATGRYDDDATHAAVKWMTALRRNASAVYIGLNIASILKVPASISLAATDIS